MRKLILAASLALLGATAAHAQVPSVCMTADDVRVCLEVPSSAPTCDPGQVPAVTLVAQTTDVSVTLAGTPVCVVRVVPGSSIKADPTAKPPVFADPLVAVITKVVLATGNGATQVVTRESQYYSSQLSGATVSSALTLSK